LQHIATHCNLLRVAHATWHVTCVGTHACVYITHALCVCIYYTWAHIHILHMGTHVCIYILHMHCVCIHILHMHCACIYIQTHTSRHILNHMQGSFHEKSYVWWKGALFIMSSLPFMICRLLCLTCRLLCLTCRLPFMTYREHVQFFFRVINRALLIMSRNPFMTYKTFSKDMSLLHLLYKMTPELTFENLYQLCGFVSC